MPGSSTGEGGPAPILNPSAGEWPPLPGRYRRVRPTSTPASSSGRSGHHSGSEWKPTCLGQVSEDPYLQLADQREKEVGRCRDGNADNGGQHQQRDVAPGPQQRKRIGRHATALRGCLGPNHGPPSARDLSPGCRSDRRTRPGLSNSPAAGEFAGRRPAHLADMHRASLAPDGPAPLRLRNRVIRLRNGDHDGIWAAPLVIINGPATILNNGYLRAGIFHWLVSRPG